MIKKILLSPFAFAIIGSISFSIDSGPPKQKTVKFSKIEKDDIYVASKFQVVSAVDQACLREETPTGEKYQGYAKSTALKDAPASAIDNATLFYCNNNKKITRTNTRDMSYAQLGYSKSYWRV